VAYRDVVGLDIIMHESGFVEFLQRLKDMKADLQCHNFMFQNQSFEVGHWRAKHLHHHKEKLVFARNFLDLLCVDAIIRDNDFSFPEILWYEIAFQAL
jgi:hypothetical protein